MNLHNITIITGRVANEIKLETLPNSNTQFTIFRVATIKKSKQEITTQFIPIKAFDKMATFIANYINKGDLINLVCNLDVNDIKQENGLYKQFWSLTVKDIKKLAKPKNNLQQKLNIDNIQQPNTTIIQ